MPMTAGATMRSDPMKSARRSSAICRRTHSEEKLCSLGCVMYMKNKKKALHRAFGAHLRVMRSVVPSPISRRASYSSHSFRLVLALGAGLLMNTQKEAREGEFSSRPFMCDLVMSGHSGLKYKFYLTF